MVRPDRDLLDETVEVDETILGGVKAGRRGRGAAGKALVAIAVERRDGGPGRTRMRRIPHASKDVLTDFVLDHVARGSEVRTDGWSGYNGVGEHRFSHVVTNVKTSGDPAHVAMPEVHRVASLLKRWLLGTHQGAVSHDQLDYYLDEFTFRFNRRRARHRGLLFYRLLEQAVATDPHPRSTAQRAKSQAPPDSGGAKQIAHFQFLRLGGRMRPTGERVRVGPLAGAGEPVRTRAELSRGGFRPAPPVHQDGIALLSVDAVRAIALLKGVSIPLPARTKRHIVCWASSLPVAHGEASRCRGRRGGRRRPG
jgi:transposase-like protein